MNRPENPLFKGGKRPHSAQEDCDFFQLMKIKSLSSRSDNVKKCPNGSDSIRRFRHEGQTRLYVVKKTPESKT